MQSDYVVSFIKELRLKNYSDNTISCYSGIVEKFLGYFKLNPKNIFESQIKDYILKYNNSSTKAQLIGALNLFYKMVIHQPEKFKYIEYPRKEQKLPQVLSIKETQDLFNIIQNKKHKAITALLYSCGLRVSELIDLKISDIDSQRMKIFIRQSKGFKDRYVNLDQSVLELLREYYKQYNPKVFLFNGQGTDQYSESSIRQFLNRYAIDACIKKHLHPHCFRHTYAVHSLESGVDIRFIQVLLGHNSAKSTARYTHVANLNMSNIKSPIQNIKIQ